MSAWNILVLHATVYIGTKKVLNSRWLFGRSVSMFHPSTWSHTWVQSQYCMWHQTLMLWTFITCVNFCLHWFRSTCRCWTSSVLNSHCSHTNSAVSLVLETHLLHWLSEVFLVPFLNQDHFTADHNPVWTLWGTCMNSCQISNPSSSVCFFYLDFWKYCTITPNRCTGVFHRFVINCYFILCEIDLSTTAL